MRGKGWSGNASEINPDPGPASGLHDAGSVKNGNEPQQATHGTGRRNNKPTGCGIGNRSALIVPVKAGNRDHRNPVEESGASHGQNRGRETREDAVPRKRVTATNPDSRLGYANLPCEEPDALMRACPDLWGEGLGNDPSYPARDGAGTTQRGNTQSPGKTSGSARSGKTGKEPSINRHYKASRLHRTLTLPRLNASVGR